MLKSFNYPLIAGVFILIIGTAAIGILRLDIDTDVVRSLPSDQSVISDALEIFTNHPIHDQIAVDITLDKDDPNILIECGELVEQKLRASGLFAEVGINEVSKLLPDLALHVITNLPLMFSQEELEQEITPRLGKEFIQLRLNELLLKLSSLEGIGQSTFMAADPLGLMEPVMAKMALLAPSTESRIYKGQLLSADNRHLLVTARPRTAGTDTASAQQISALLATIAKDLSHTYTPRGINVTLTPVGAYRAALDNERIIRHDVQLALLLSTVGIGLLLFFAFPRPLLGIFALLPAFAGTAAALFVFSLFHHSISIMVLGFGGAIISITVDHGIAYLLFLDRPQETKGKEASREVYAVGILTVLTTIGAFLILSFSGFPIFVQLGQFTALGVLFSFLFVHSIFPRLIPSLPPAKRRSLPLQGLVDRLYRTGPIGAVSAAALALVLLFFAHPQFNVSLESMNTVSSETLAADQMFASVWGNMGKRIFLMVKGDSIDEIQQKNDIILQKINTDKKSDIIQSAFVPSMIFPGTLRTRDNLTAWQQFWNRDKIATVQKELETSGAALGFAPHAFDQFLGVLQSPLQATASLLPSRYYQLMGISEKKGSLVQFITLSPGPRYNSQNFIDHYGQEAKIFDSPFFSAQLANILFTTFATILGIIAVSIAALLFFFFLSWQLTLITLLPPLFSYICTLGTMKLIGHPLDIPSLMLSIIILGMGIDYSIFFVKAHQRYRNPDHPAFQLVRMTVFMAATSTLIGFGVLCLAEHSLLRSIGITSLLGIGYSLLGAFLLLPPLLQAFFSDKKQPATEQSLSQLILARYRLMEAYPKMFARFKLKFDPIFDDLAALLAEHKADIKIILDIGCGYGVPGCWCLEYFPQANIIGMDPDPERVRVAALAMGERGTIFQDGAPHLPALARPVDLVLLLDMLHYLDDETMTTLFTNCFQALAPGGILVIRYAIQPEASRSSSWLLEDYRVKFSGSKPWYRSPEKMAGFMTAARLVVETNMVSPRNSELVWLIGRADKDETSDK
ncbi:MAG: MMPL family transporter [Desulfocapsaceae bacterium]|nr:MMPL family transporter [Desulfocapsaceae bacterium]